MTSRKYVLFLCVLVLTSVIDAGFIKSRRQSELAMLLAGGLLTILFQESADLVKKNFEHPQVHPLAEYALPAPMIGHGHHFPLHHGIEHLMSGFPYHGPGPRHGHRMGNFGNHFPYTNMLPRNPIQLPHFPVLRHGFPYAGLPMPPSVGHGFPFMMHELNLPLNHGVTLGHGSKDLYFLNNGARDSSYRSNSASDDDDFEQIFKKLENQEPESYDGYRAGNYEDSPVPPRYDEDFQKPESYDGYSEGEYEDSSMPLRYDEGRKENLD